jgi:membrane protein
VQRNTVSIWQIVKAAFHDFNADDCGLRAAALAYYTVFALPPLLILLVMIVGLIWSPEQVATALERQFAGLIGPAGAQQVHQIIAHGQSTPGGGRIAATYSIVGIVLGATGFFLGLQDALNQVWKVKPDPAKGGVKQFLGKRLLSAGMVLGIGFLLAVSLSLTTAVAAVGGVIGGSLAAPALEAINQLTSLVVLSLLFAALYKVLPDADISWRDVGVGAVATAVLFVVGKSIIGLYLGLSKPGDAFGAASALAVVLVWVYYSAMMLLLGAEFTREWATQRGRGIEPEEGAVRVIQQEKLVRPDEMGGRTGATQPPDRTLR